MSLPFNENITIYLHKLVYESTVLEIFYAK